MSKLVTEQEQQRREAELREQVAQLRAEREQAMAAVTGYQRRVEELVREVEAAISAEQALRRERDDIRAWGESAAQGLKAVEKVLEDATGEPVPFHTPTHEAVFGLIEDLEARAIQAERGTPLHERYAETLHALAGELERPEDRLEALRLGVVALTGPEVAARRAG